MLLFVFTTVDNKKKKKEFKNYYCLGGIIIIIHDDHHIEFMNLVLGGGPFAYDTVSFARLQTLLKATFTS